MRRTVRGRLVRTSAAVTALACALFGVLAFVFMYVVEDEFFAALLEAEAASIAAGAMQPRLPFVTLYGRWSDVPEEVRIHGTPRSREVAGSEGRHYHVARVTSAGGEEAYLVADVGSMLVVRRMRGTLLLILLPATAMVMAASVLAAALAARRSVRQLSALADAVQKDGAPAAHFLSDATDEEIRLLARALDDSLGRLRDALQREQAFVGDVSHELRTPLAVISGAAELLERRGLEAPAASQVRRIRDAARSGQELTELMLALAREETAREAPSSIALLPLVETLILRHRQLLARADSRIEVDIAPAAQIVAPRTATEVILSNLLSNAFRHGGSAVAIRADARSLTIRDDGAGLDPKNRRRGIGLDLVHRLCAVCGFTLRLQSTDAGTVITVVFGDVGHTA